MTKFASKLGAVAIAAAVIVGATGVAGAQTVDLQAQIAALMAQIAALQAQAGTSTATGTTYTFTRDLTVGSTGQDVKELQKFLNANGYAVATTGAGSAGMESTYFGNATKAALIKFQAAKGITPSAGYFGAKTRAYIATMSSTTPTTPTTPVVVSSPLSVKLASDNAASANVQKGSANNQVLKFTLTGAADVATSVTGLTLKSYGTTESTGSTDVSAVKLYDENGVQLGNNRTPAGNQVNFVIVPALTIPAGGSRTVTVTADFGSSATTMAIARYGIESAAGILSGATFTGTYPLIGNSFTIVPAGQLGTIAVGQFGSLPKSSVKVGEKDIVLERFNVSAGSNEDIAVNQITVTRSGNAADSSVSNIRLRKVGETAVLGGPVSFSNKKATFNLTSTINLTKGSSVNLEVIADIVDGTASPIAANIAAGGVIGRGATSGTNITSTGSTTANNITIGNETATVSMSSSHPQGADSYIIKTTNKKDIAKFDVRANGGDVIFNTINVKFVDATDALTASNYVSSVGLYEGDSLVSDLITVDDENDQSFALNYTVPANTTKTLTVKGITNTLTAAAGGDTFTTTWSGYTGYGLASGEAITSTADVTSTSITIYQSGTTTNTADTSKTPYNQGILAPSNGVTIAALKMYGQREDMKLTDLVLTVTGTAYDDEADISSITLYADDGVTQLSNAVAYDDAANDTTDTFTFASADFLNDIVVAKGVYKTILVKANVSTGMDGASDVTATIANAASQLVFDGQDSGTAYDASAVAGVTFAISSPYNGGTFSSDTKVVQIEKDSTSPSGSVARGTQSVTGIWTANNYDSTNADSVITAVTFTSKTGLPSALDDAADDTLFALYDGEGNLLAGGTGDDAGVTLTKASGTVAFSSVGLTINPGAPKQLKLVIDTTSTAKFASNTQLQWSIEAVGDVTVTGGVVGYGAGKWTIPAVANVVTLP